MTKPPYVTAKQNQWFKSIQAGLEKDTQKSLDEWIKIAETCPETKHKARLDWFKTRHGLGINRASLVLNATFKSGLGWDNPNVLLDNLWKTPETRAIYNQVEIITKGLGSDVIVTARKSFSAFSRKVQFAALRPSRYGVRLGLALPLADAPYLTEPLSSDSWSDRLTAVQLLNKLDDIDETVLSCLSKAYARSG